MAAIPRSMSTDRCSFLCLFANALEIAADEREECAMEKAFKRVLVLFVLALLGFGAFVSGHSFVTKADRDALAPQSVTSSVQYLARAMDQYHNRFPVYDDVSSAGNHFHAL